MLDDMEIAKKVEIKPIQRQKQPAVRCNEIDGIQEEIDFQVIHDIVHADSAPTGLDAGISIDHTDTVFLGGFFIDVQQTVSIRTGTGTTCP